MLLSGFLSEMERDFLGLSSKEPLAMVKEEIDNDGVQDSGKFSSGSVLFLCFGILCLLLVES